MVSDPEFTDPNREWITANSNTGHLHSIRNNRTLVHKPRDDDGEDGEWDEPKNKRINYQSHIDRFSSHCPNNDYYFYFPSISPSPFTTNVTNKTYKIIQGRISPVKADVYYFCLRRDRLLKTKHPGLHCRVTEANFGIPSFGAFVEIREEQIEDCRDIFEGGNKDEDDDDQFDSTIPFNVVKTPVEQPVERERTSREEYEEMCTVLLQRIRDRTGISKSSYQTNFCSSSVTSQMNTELNKIQYGIDNAPKFKLDGKWGRTIPITFRLKEKSRHITKLAKNIRQQISEKIDLSTISKTLFVLLYDQQSIGWLQKRTEWKPAEETDQLVRECKELFI